MTHYEKIRAALEVAREYMQESLNNERAAYKGHESISNIGEMNADIVRNRNALAALAELERAAKEPVAWMWNDLIGIPHTCVSPTRPTWPDAGSSPAMAVAINVRPLYAAPVAEIREPSDAECENIWLRFQDAPMFANPAMSGRAMFDAVSAVMWPKSEGL